MLPGHLDTAQAGEGGIRKMRSQCRDELGAVGIAGGFASGEKDTRIGDCGDESSLSLSEARAGR
jgi:hypothetical protein